MQKKCQQVKLIDENQKHKQQPTRVVISDSLYCKIQIKKSVGQFSSTHLNFMFLMQYGTYENNKLLARYYQVRACIIHMTQIQLYDVIRIATHSLRGIFFSCLLYESIVYGYFLTDFMLISLNLLSQSTIHAGLIIYEESHQHSEPFHLCVK